MKTTMVYLNTDISGDDTGLSKLRKHDSSVAINTIFSAAFPSASMFLFRTTTTQSLLDRRRCIDFARTGVHSMTIMQELLLNLKSQRCSFESCVLDHIPLTVSDRDLFASLLHLLVPGVLLVSTRSVAMMAMLASRKPVYSLVRYRAIRFLKTHYPITWLDMSLPENVAPPFVRMALKHLWNVPLEIVIQLQAIERYNHMVANYKTKVEVTVMDTGVACVCHMVLRDLLKQPGGGVHLWGFTDDMARLCETIKDSDERIIPYTERIKIALCCYSPAFPRPQPGLLMHPNGCPIITPWPQLMYKINTQITYAPLPYVSCTMCAKRVPIRLLCESSVVCKRCVDLNA